MSSRDSILQFKMSSGVSQEVQRAFADTARHINSISDRQANLVEMIIETKNSLITVIDRKFDALSRRIREVDHPANGDDMGDLFERYDPELTPHGGIRLPHPKAMELKMELTDLRDKVAALGKERDFEKARAQWAADLEEKATKRLKLLMLIGGILAPILTLAGFVYHFLSLAK
jgi:hypothetical protein